MGIKSQPEYDQWSAEQHEEEVRMITAAQTDLIRFAPLYERYAPRIYAYCLRRLDNRDEAEDLTSQIFTQAMKALEGYRGGSAAAWLFRIAHNTVVSHFRARRIQVSLDDLEYQYSDDENSMIDTIVQAESQQ